MDTLHTRVRPWTRLTGLATPLIALALFSGCDEGPLTPRDPEQRDAGPHDVDPHDAGPHDADDAAMPVEPSGDGGVDAAMPPVTNDCPRARVRTSPGTGLNLRPSPSTHEAPVASLPNNAFLEVLERVTGQVVEGDDEWLHVRWNGHEGYVSAVYAECTTDEPPILELDGFYLPLECGTSARISQGNNGGFSHTGRARYGFDFALGVGVPMVAMADGEVLHIYDQTGPGHRCYNGGGSDCYAYANLVVLLHTDGTTTIYKHLSAVSVSLGEIVLRGSPVGLSGSTGYSTGPHAHIMRQEDCGEANCQSIPMEFVDVPGNGIPETGDTVTSGNCP